MRREHLVAGVDIHIHPARLFKEVGEILEVVAGDEDTRPRARRGPDGRDRRRPVGGGVRGIEVIKDIKRWAPRWKIENLACGAQDCRDCVL